MKKKKEQDEFNDFIESELEFLCGILGTKLKKESEPQNQQQVKREFKKSDKVYDRINFPGIIGIVWEIKTYTSQIYVIVHFGSSIAAYNTDGCVKEGSIKTLFHHDYEIEIKPVQETFKKDELVLVREDRSAEWRVRKFIEKKDGYYVCHETKNGICTGWRYCIKFDPEKALRITKD